MTDKKFAFDRESDSVVPTRNFDHGVVHGKKDEALSAGQVRDLSDDAIRHLVEIAKVAKVVKGKSAPAGGDDKGAAKA